MLLEVYWGHGEVTMQACDIQSARPRWGVGLPPPGLASTVSAEHLSEGYLKELIRRPELTVYPREQWPDEFPEARVRVEDDEWRPIVDYLVELGLFVLLAAAQLVWHNGKALLNGLFGVGKGKFVDVGGIQKEVLRLIINLIPSNSIQGLIEGDIRALPFSASGSG